MIIDVAERRRSCRNMAGLMLGTALGLATWVAVVAAIVGLAR